MTRGNIINLGIMAAALAIVLTAVAGGPFLAGMAGFSPGGSNDPAAVASGDPPAVSSGNPTAASSDTATSSDAAASSYTAASDDTGAAGAGWTLVWQDEFDQAKGSAPDPAKWNYDLGGDGWGNDELQNYTSSRSNSYIENGCLVIKALKQSLAGNAYTSARLVTRDLEAWSGGRIEVRAVLPRGQGIWPAIWLLPQDDTYGDYRKNGEIDIMEMIGSEPNSIYGSIHFFKDGDVHSEVNSFIMDSGFQSFRFHTYAVEWDAKTITWYVDDLKAASEDLNKMFPSPAYKPFQQKFYLVMNVAVGGTWPGDPAPNTVFPQKMLVDYVRVYKPAANQ